MKCSKCGQESSEDSNFCTNCGNSFTTTPRSAKAAEIKCGNCGYIGPGEKNRRLISKILAWLCVVLIPIVTIIYYVATPRYRCPKCKSTFLGVKNKEGIYQGQRGGGSKALIIFICIIAGIAIIGILASVVLASLNAARIKGTDAAVKADLSNMRPQAEIYWDVKSTNGKNGSYAGVCESPEIANFLSMVPKVNGIEPTCNDKKEEYAISAPLASDGYWCVDDTGTSKAIANPLGSETHCPGSTTAVTATGTDSNSTSSGWVTYVDPNGDFTIDFPKYPEYSHEDDNLLDGGGTYNWYSYVSDDGQSSFQIHKYVYSDGLNASDTDAVLKAMVDSFENTDPNNQLVSSSYTNYYGSRALNFVIKGKEENMKGRAIVDGEIPYLVLMDYYPSNYNDSSYNKFINSFRMK